LGAGRNNVARMWSPSIRTQTNRGRAMRISHLSIRTPPLLLLPPKLSLRFPATASRPGPSSTSNLNRPHRTTLPREMVSVPETQQTHQPPHSLLRLPLPSPPHLRLSSPRKQRRKEGRLTAATTPHSSYSRRTPPRPVIAGID